MRAASDCISVQSTPPAGDDTDDYGVRLLASEGPCGKSARALAAARVVKAEEAARAQLAAVMAGIDKATGLEAYERLSLRREQSARRALSAISLLAALHEELPPSFTIDKNYEDQVEKPRKEGHYA